MFHPKFQLPDDAVVITKGVRFDKDQNSAFDDTGLETRLKKLSIRRLFIGGLAMGICVLQTVLDAINFGFDVMLIKSATKPVTRDTGQKALSRMTDAGARVVEPNPPGPVFCTKAPEWAEHARLNEDDDACDDGRAGRI